MTEHILKTKKTEQTKQKQSYKKNTHILFKEREKKEKSQIVEVVLKWKKSASRRGHH